MPDIFVQPSEPKPAPENYNSSVLRNAVPNTSMLAAYCLKPPDVGFDLQHDEEKVLLLLRQHPIVNIPWILITILLVIAPFVILPIVPLFRFFPGNFQFVAIIGWYTVVLGYALEQFLLWFFNVYLVTDERVIDMDFYNLLFKKVSEAKIERIEDISAFNSGFLQSVVDYGNIRIQTAAEIPEIQFELVPHPDQVQKFLSEMIDEEERERLEGRVR